MASIGSATPRVPPREPLPTSRDASFSLPPLSAHLSAALSSHPLPRVTATSFAVTDGEGRLLGGKSASSPLQMASITKVMTAHVILLAVERVACSGGPDSDLLSELVLISPEAASMPGTSADLRPGEVYTVLDLLYAMLLPSGNDAACALAEYVGDLYPLPSHGGRSVRDHPHTRFVAAMNREAARLGLAHTRFGNVHGLSDTRQQSSAWDVCRLTAIVSGHPLFKSIVGTRSHTAVVRAIPAKLMRHGKWGMGSKRAYPATSTWSNTNVLLGTTVRNASIANVVVSIPSPALVATAPPVSQRGVPVSRFKSTPVASTCGSDDVSTARTSRGLEHRTASESISVLDATPVTRLELCVSVTPPPGGDVDLTSTSGMRPNSRRSRGREEEERSSRSKSSSGKQTLKRRSPSRSRGRKSASARTTHGAGELMAGAAAMHAVRSTSALDGMLMTGGASYTSEEEEEVEAGALPVAPMAPAPGPMLRVRRPVMRECVYEYAGGKTGITPVAGGCLVSQLHLVDVGVCPSGADVTAADILDGVDALTKAKLCEGSVTRATVRTNADAAAMDAVRRGDADATPHAPPPSQIIIAVLGSDCKTTRFTDTQAVAAWVLRGLTR